MISSSLCSLVLFGSVFLQQHYAVSALSTNFNRYDQQQLRNVEQFYPNEPLQSIQSSFAADRGTGKGLPSTANNYDLKIEKIEKTPRNIKYSIDFDKNKKDKQVGSDSIIYNIDVPDKDPKSNVRYNFNYKSKLTNKQRKLFDLINKVDKSIFVEKDEILENLHKLIDEDATPAARSQPCGCQSTCNCQRSNIEQYHQCPCSNNYNNPPELDTVFYDQHRFYNDQFSLDDPVTFINLDDDSPVHSKRYKRHIFDFDRDNKNIRVTEPYVSPQSAHYQQQVYQINNQNSGNDILRPGQLFQKRKQKSQNKPKDTNNQRQNNAKPDNEERDWSDEIPGAIKSQFVKTYFENFHTPNNNNFQYNEDLVRPSIFGGGYRLPDTEQYVTDQNTDDEEVEETDPVNEDTDNNVRPLSPFIQKLKDKTQAFRKKMDEKKLGMKIKLAEKIKSNIEARLQRAHKLNRFDEDEESDGYESNFRRKRDVVIEEPIDEPIEEPTDDKFETLYSLNHYEFVDYVPSKHDYTIDEEEFLRQKEEYLRQKEEQSENNELESESEVKEEDETDKETYIRYDVEEDKAPQRYYHSLKDELVERKNDEEEIKTKNEKYDDERPYRYYHSRPMLAEILDDTDLKLLTRRRKHCTTCDQQPPEYSPTNSYEQSTIIDPATINQPFYIEYRQGAAVPYKPGKIPYSPKESSSKIELPRFVFDRFGHRYVENDGNLRLVKPNYLQSEQTVSIPTPPPPPPPSPMPTLATQPAPTVQYTAALPTLDEPIVGDEYQYPSQPYYGNYQGLSNILDNNYQNMKDRNNGADGQLVQPPIHLAMDAINFLTELIQRNSKANEYNNPTYYDNRPDYYGSSSYMPPSNYDNFYSSNQQKRSFENAYRSQADSGTPTSDTKPITPVPKVTMSAKKFMGDGSEKKKSIYNKMHMENVQSYNKNMPHIMHLAPSVMAVGPTTLLQSKPTIISAGSSSVLVPAKDYKIMKHNPEEAYDSSLSSSRESDDPTDYAVFNYVYGKEKNEFVNNNNSHSTSSKSSVVAVPAVSGDRDDNQK